MSFAMNLNNARLKAGFSQAELADRLNVHKTTVSKWETGERTPSMRKIGSIAKILNVSLSRLVRYKGAVYIMDEASREKVMNNMEMARSALKDASKGFDHDPELFGVAIRGMKDSIAVLKKLKRSV